MEKYELEDQEWVPPTEAEMKIMQANRERSDKISQIMGRYLLSGYKMLDSVCKTCGTILLQDRRKVLYCVACSEVDNEHSKDNPALDPDAAKRQMQEGSHKTDATTNLAVDSSRITVDTDSLNEATNALSLSANLNKADTSTYHSNEKSDVKLDASWLSNSKEHLKNKIRFTTESLAESQSVSDCIQFSALIKACAETLLVLNSLDN